MNSFNWMFYTITLTVMLAFLQCACAETGDEDPPQVVVQAFYNWYTPLALKNKSLPAVDIALKDKTALFSQLLYAALAEDSAARKKRTGFIAGLDFDPFLATQDPCGEYEVGKVIHEGDEFRVEVYEVCEGKRRADPNVDVELSKKGDQWVIDNFYYPSSDGSAGDLLTILKLLKQEREKRGNGVRS